MKRPLEQELDTKLHRSWIAEAGDRGYSSYRRGRETNEVGFVKYIEDLPSQLQPHVFREPYVLGQRQVRSKNVRPCDRSATRRARHIVNV